VGCASLSKTSAETVQSDYAHDAARLGHCLESVVGRSADSGSIQVRMLSIIQWTLSAHLMTALRMIRTTSKDTESITVNVPKPSFLSVH
jgi:hypothetical protein